MDEKIDYSTVAAAVGDRLGKQLSDAVFELEQWKALASSAIAERDALRTEVTQLKQDSGETQ